MWLGTRNLTTGDTRLVEIDYSGWLDEGVILKSATVTVPPGITSTIQNVGLNEAKRRVIFYVTGGNFNENFTVNIQIMDSQSETVNDTISFTVIAP